MPTNLPPEYYEVEKRYRAASLPAEKIALLEELISTIPKHKGTEKLLGDLRRRLSKLRDTSQSRKGASRHESAFHIEREGAGRAVVVGLPNTGKSSLVAALTNADPEVSAAPFTTWSPSPGMLEIEDIQVQLIDTPPLNREYMAPELLELIRHADLVLLLVDLQAFSLQQMEEALEILEEGRIAPDHRRERFGPQDRMSFLPFLILATKCDGPAEAEDFEVHCELVGDEPWTFLPLSVVQGQGIEAFKQAIFKTLGVIRVYAKPPGQEADLSRPFVMKLGSTVADLAAEVHQDFYHNLKSARIWGSGVFEGQPVSREHVLQDGDVVELRI
jgi:ribosome-interacting GTPase 1